MIFESWGCNGRDYFPLNREFFETDKQRKKLIDRAKDDAHHSPGTEVWITEISPAGVKSYPLEVLVHA